MHQSPVPVANATSAVTASAGRLLALTLVVALAVPLALRPLNRAVLGASPRVGYLPSLRPIGGRLGFDAEPIAQLQYGKPTWVFIGDSMLGTRIDPLHLGRISSTHDENVGFLFHPGTGPAWWYLAFKNHLVASGIRPRVTFVFFRDTNLTDTLFRLETLVGGALDRVALDREPELDAIVAGARRGRWAPVHTLATRAYEADVTTEWMEPGLRRWFVNTRFPDAQARLAFDRRLEERFALATLRPDVQAELGDVSVDADFARDLPHSVLPAMLQLAREQGLTLCFVRVQRRPNGSTPPPQSPALRRYVTDLSAWLTANGAVFHDDWGAPGLTEDMYGDGDHVGDRVRYTEYFRARLDRLFR